MNATDSELENGPVIRWGKKLRPVSVVACAWREVRQDVRPEQ